MSDRVWAADADKAGVWVVTPLDGLAVSSDPLFPDGYKLPPRKFKPLFPVDGEPAARRDASWIQHAMQGIKAMHEDEATRKAVASALF